MLTKSQEKSLIKDYLKGVGTKELCKKYGWAINNRHGPLNVLKKHNIFIRQDQLTAATKYTINDSYFDKIDSPDKAYFLGLIYADGSIHYKKAEMKLSLKESDKSILEKFSQYLQTTKPLRYLNLNDKNPNFSNQYTIAIENRKLITSLQKLGIESAKSYTDMKFPGKNILPVKFYNHFIRGFFDGDGCITNSGNDPIVSFTSSESFLKSIQLIFNKYLGLSINKLHKRHADGHAYSTTWGGINVCRKIYEYLYEDNANLFIERKYIRFNEFYSPN